MHGLSCKDGDVDGQKTDKIKNDYCKFHLQGRYKFERHGKSCRKLTYHSVDLLYLKETMAVGHNFSYTNPKLCVKSLQDKSCPRKKCHFYHVNDSDYTKSANNVQSCFILIQLVTRYLMAASTLQLTRNCISNLYKFLG